MTTAKRKLSEFGGVSNGGGVEGTLRAAFDAIDEGGTLIFDALSFEGNSSPTFEYAVFSTVTINKSVLIEGETPDVKLVNKTSGGPVFQVVPNKEGFFFGVENLLFTSGSIGVLITGSRALSPNSRIYNVAFIGQVSASIKTTVPEVNLHLENVHFRGSPQYGIHIENSRNHANFSIDKCKIEETSIAGIYYNGADLNSGSVYISDSEINNNNQAIVVNNLRYYEHNVEYFQNQANYVLSGSSIRLTGSAGGGGGGGVTDHGMLTGLADDDHRQYLLISGTRGMSGSLNMNEHNIINVGTVDGVDVALLDSTLDSHILDVTNPHSTKFSNLVPETLANLNSAISDANVPSEASFLALSSTFQSVSASLQQATASLQSSTASLQSFSATLLAASSTFRSELNVLNSASASFVSDFSLLFNASASFRSEINAIKAASSSWQSATASLQSTTASLQSFSATLLAFSSSHATRHLSGGADPIDAQSLRGNGLAVNRLLISDGLGGWTTVPSSSIVGAAGAHASTHHSGGSDPLDVHLLRANGIGIDRILIADGIGGWITVPSSSVGIYDHGGLQGLGDNDHTQYTLRTEFQPFSATIQNFTASIQSATASLQNVSASYLAVSASYNTLSASYLAVSASYNTLSASYLAVSSSHNTLSASYLATSASYNQVSASFIGFSSSHASRHLSGGVDPIDAQSLRANGIAINRLLISDGLGGWTTVLSSTVAGGGGVTDHGDLTGLADNDHPQYTLRTEFQPFSATLQDFTASVQTSTASLQIATASLQTVSASYLAVSASYNVLSASYLAVSASYDTTSASYRAVSASYNTLSASYLAVSASYNVISASYISHASRHLSGGVDPIDAQSLRGNGLAVDRILISNGLGGWTTVASSSVGVYDHGALQGLADNDHPQYTLRTEFQPFSATLQEFTASTQIATASLQTVSASYLAVSASYNVLSSSYLAISASYDVISASYRPVSASYNTLSASYMAVSSSYNQVSASFVGFSSSHASRHLSGGVDPIDAQSLRGNGLAVDRLLISNGLGGWTTVASSSIGIYDHGGLLGLSDNDHPQYTLRIEFQPFSATLQEFTASVQIATASLQTVSASYLAVSASYNTLSASYLAVSASYNTLSSSYLAVSSSYNVLSASYLAISASYDVISASYRPVSASYNTLSASYMAISASYNTLSSTLIFHASRHLSGGVDPIDAQSLRGDGLAVNRLLISNGLGGWTTVASSSVVKDYDAFTASVQIATASLQTVSASYLAVSASYNTLSASYMAVSASYNVISASYRPVSASYNTLSSSYYAVSASYDVISASYRPVSASYNTLSASYIAVSSSYNQVSASFIGFSSSHASRHLSGAADPIDAQSLRGNGLAVDRLLISNGLGGWTTVASSSVGIYDHGGLVGLADNDHPQYTLRTEFQPFSATLQEFTASVQTATASLQTVSASYLAVSASYNTLSASYLAVSASYNIISASYRPVSASYNTLSASYYAVSASYDVISASYRPVSASYNTLSASYMAVSASYNTISASYITHASRHLSGGADPIDAQSLRANAIAVDRLLISDGLGGWTTVHSSSVAGAGGKDYDAFTASVQIATASLQTVSASYLEVSASYNTLSASYMAVSSSFNIISASYRPVSASYNVVSASYIAVSSSYNVISASYLAVSSSYNTLSASYLATSASYDTLSASYLAVSASYNIISASYRPVSASYNTLSASYYAVSASYDVISASYRPVSASYNTLSASYIAVSASYNQVSASFVGFSSSHASRHLSGAADQISAQSLAANGIAANRLLISNQDGGWTTIASGTIKDHDHMTIVHGYSTSSYYRTSNLTQSVNFTVGVFARVFDVDSTLSNRALISNLENEFIGPGFALISDTDRLRAKITDNLGTVYDNYVGSRWAPGSNGQLFVVNFVKSGSNRTIYLNGEVIYDATLPGEAYGSGTAQFMLGAATGTWGNGWDGGIGGWAYKRNYLSASQIREFSRKIMETSRINEAISLAGWEHAWSFDGQVSPPGVLTDIGTSGSAHASLTGSLTLTVSENRSFLSSIDSDTSTPNPHGSSHLSGATDAINAQSLGGSGLAINRLLITDGLGGWTTVLSSAVGGAGGKDYDSFTASVQIATGSLQTVSASYLAVSASYNILSASYLATSASYEVISASYRPVSASYNTLSASYLAVSASYNTISASYLAVSSSYNTLSASYLAVSASYNTISASYRPTSASFEVISASYIAVSSSYNTVSASYRPMSASFEVISASYRPVSASYNTLSASYIAVSSSYNTLSASYLAVSSSYNTVSASYLAVSASYNVISASYISHASRHLSGGVDPIDAQSLRGNGLASNRVLITNNAGGWTTVASSSLGGGSAGTAYVGKGFTYPSTGNDGDFYYNTTSSVAQGGNDFVVAVLADVHSIGTIAGSAFDLASKTDLSDGWRLYIQPSTDPVVGFGVSNVGNLAYVTYQDTTSSVGRTVCYMLGRKYDDGQFNSFGQMNGKLIEVAATFNPFTPSTEPLKIGSGSVGSPVSASILGFAYFTGTFTYAQLRDVGGRAQIEGKIPEDVISWTTLFRGEDLQTTASIVSSSAGGHPVLRRSGTLVPATTYTHTGGSTYTITNNNTITGSFTTISVISSSRQDGFVTGTLKEIPLLFVSESSQIVAIKGLPSNNANYYFDDFDNAVVTAAGFGWTFAAGGTGGGIAVQDVDANNFTDLMGPAIGALVLDTGTTAGGGALLRKNPTSYSMRRMTSSFIEWRAAVSGTFTSTTQEFRVKLGWLDSVTTASRDPSGAGLYFESSGSLNSALTWHITAKSGSSITRYNTGANIRYTGSAGNYLQYQAFGIETIQNPPGAFTSTFWIDGIQVGAISTSIPIARNQSVGPTIVISKEIGTAQRDLYVDWCKMFYEINR